MEITIGQRILAAVIAHQLGVPMDLALRNHVCGREIDPVWEKIGEELLRTAMASTKIPVRHGL